VLAALGLVFASVFVAAAPAQAATATVTMTPAATTVPSHTPVTYTVSINCSGAGGCEDTVLSFPTNTITGNGANNDIGSWFGQSSCGFVTRTVGGGLVSYNYGDLATGIQNCDITVLAPEYTTLNNAVATLTPTVSGSTFPTFTGTPVTLTSTAGYNVSLNVFGTPQVLPGAQVTYTLRLICGENRQYDGDIGVNYVRVEAELPSNFIYSGFSTGNGRPASVTVTEPTVGGNGGTFVYEDSTGATCGNPPLNISNAMDIFVRGVIDGPVGTQACLSGDAEFTYLDGVPGQSSSTTPNCPTVVDIDTVVAKGNTTTSLANVGKYPVPGGGQYTYPGNWDQSGAPVTFQLNARTNPAANNANVAYLINDPLPCLDNLVGGVYLSNAVGDLCQNPAFIPNRITATGFTPAATDEIVLHYADGSTGTIPFAAGQWTLPNPAPGGGIAEVEFPAFASQGANVGTIVFLMSGWASPNAVPGNMLRNTTSTDPYLVGQPDPLRTDQLAHSNVWIADPNDGPGETGNTTLYPSVTTGGPLANCSFNVTWNGRNFIEITQVSSEAIYFDYLAPVGATVTAGASRVFTFTGTGNGQSFPSASIAAVLTPDYQGTGRTLYSWTIPAGLITVPGQYRVDQPNMSVSVGAGCAGTYNSDMTMGYGAPVFKCLYNPGSSPRVEDPPMLPKLNGDLTTNSGPIEDNFCGFSARTIFEAINEGYVLNKTVQGNLDPAPAAPGTNGRVSPEGGEATYTISFRNSGDANLTDPVMYDLLPAIGDTIASGSTPRDSDFGVELLSMGALPAGLSVEYSTAANPCRPELLTDPSCTDDWSATAPADLADTTALRFSYDGTVYVAGGAGINQFEVQYTVATPAAENGDVAWNSVGTNVFAGDDLMGASESTLVGLEAADSPLLVTKSASASTFDAVGDTIDYTFTVTNGSGVTLTGVTVVDEFTDAAAGSTAPTPECIELTNPAATCSGTSVTLLDGQIATFGASYTTTQDDLDHGGVTDAATATGTPPTGGPLEGSSNTVAVAAQQNAALSLLKEADPTTVDEDGDTVEYTFVVENIGNVTVTGIGIDETDFSGTGALSVDCPTVPLSPGDDLECAATYEVTQADVDAGIITNTATATGTAPDGVVESATSSATVVVTQLPSLDLAKSATPDEVSSVDQTVTYSFLVTNDGNVTISDIAIDETDFSGAGTLSAIDCPVQTLAPDDDVTCTATYEVQQEDLDAGSITNTAAAVGNDPSGAPIPTPPTSEFTVDVLSLPAISLEKSADLEASEDGATITYTFVVTNEGNVALSGVGVDDPMVGLSAIDFDWPGDPGDLGARDSVTGTATYTVSQADIDAGTLLNSATATGTPAVGEDVTDGGDATVTFVQDPQLSMIKTGELSDPDGIDVGSEVLFEFEITNDGNVTVENVDIDDDLVGLSSITFGTWPGAVGVLEPGDTVTASATYELTADDLETGSVVNIATATGDAPGGDPSYATSVTVPLEVSPAVTIDKVGTLDTADPPVAGDTITFDFTVENTGNVPLTSVEIDDELAGLGAIEYTWPSATDGRIGAGEEMTATATYTLTQDDIDAGSVVNTATVNGDAPGSDTATATDVEQVDLPAAPAITLTKTSGFDSDMPMAGDEVTFEFTVENTGNVTVTGVDIADGMIGLSGIIFGAWPGIEGELAPGDSVVATATYELTQADIDAGSIENEATASGDAVRGGAVTDEAAVTVTLSQVPALDLVKTADHENARLGDVIVFTIIGTNIGNITVTELVIEDGLPGLSALDFEWPGDEGVLAPGEAVTVTAEYTVTSDDVQSREVVNTATATALTVGLATVSATAVANVVIEPAAAPLAFTGAAVSLLAGGVGLALLGGGLAVLLGLRIRARRA
jgi:uncharacterized repeat protein (TIGR01451 family)